jgi:hypothetical protein
MKCRYLEVTLTDQNCMHAEVKSRLNSGNTSYYSFNKLVSFHLLPKDILIKVYKTLILHIILYEYEAWSLILREEHWLVVPENRV